MKTISEMVAVTQHFAAGGKVEKAYGSTWREVVNPTWNWWFSDYRIAEVDPYAELKKANQPGSGKQIRCSSAVGIGDALVIGWQDAGYEWGGNCAPHCYEIRDKPKPMKKVKLLAWFDGLSIVWREESHAMNCNWKNIPGLDKEIEVEDD